jgi:lysozyme
MSAILPVANALLGIDVSHWQGEIDWVKVAESGVKFVFIKATEGNSITDPCFKKNVDGVAAVGLPFGLYHFWRPDVPAVEQVNFFRLTRDQNVPYTAQYAKLTWLAMDIETGAMNEDTQQAALQAFSDAFAVKPVIYTSPYDAQGNLTDPAWLDYPLWIAHYTEAEKPNTVKWPVWTFWQRQSDGEIPGITGAVDIDWFPEEEFQKLSYLPT